MATKPPTSHHVEVCAVFALPKQNTGPHRHGAMVPPASQPFDVPRVQDPSSPGALWHAHLPGAAGYHRSPRLVKDLWQKMSKKNCMKRSDWYHTWLVSYLIGIIPRHIIDNYMDDTHIWYPKSSRKDLPALSHKTTRHQGPHHYVVWEWATSNSMNPHGPY